MSDDKPDSTGKDSNQTITVDANEFKVDNSDKPEIQPHTEPDVDMSDDELKQIVTEIASEAHKPSEECLPLDVQLPDDEFNNLDADITSEAHKIKKR